MKFIKLLLIINMTLLASVSSLFPKESISSHIIKGRILDVDGKPIEDVSSTVLFPRTMSAVDENGYFSLTLYSDTAKDDCCAIRFSAPGFQQHTEIFKYDVKELAINLDRGDNKWIPHLCKDSPDLSKRVGWELKALPASGANIIKNIDSDNIRINIEFNSESERRSLEFGTGHLWAATIPKKELFMDNISIREKELRAELYSYSYKDGQYYATGVKWQSGVDYRGVDKQGKTWRYIGLGQQTIFYREASPSAATYFDAIIDSICVDPIMVVNGKLRRLSGIPDKWR